MDQFQACQFQLSVAGWSHTQSGDVHCVSVDLRLVVVTARFPFLPRIPHEMGTIRRASQCMRHVMRSFYISYVNRLFE